MNDVNPVKEPENNAPAAHDAGEHKHRKKKKRINAAAIAAFLALATSAVAFFSDIPKLLTTYRQLIHPAHECKVDINSFEAPASVAYSRWDDMAIKLKGKYNCSENFGLYVTFIPHNRSNARWRLEPPANINQCRDIDGSLLHPQCWDPKKPIAVTPDGTWEWRINPPLLSKIGEFGAVEEIDLQYEVRDFDSPDKTLSTSKVTINVTRDADS